jgi:hypothetical protein
MAKKQQDTIHLPFQGPPKASRFDAAARAVRELTEPVTLARLNEIAYEHFVAAGGKADLKIMLVDTKQAIKMAASFGIVAVDRAVTIRPVSKP